MKLGIFFDDVNLKMPGYAMVVIKDGKTVRMETKGLADLERKIPITTKTAFRLASLTKQFTAMAVLILAEQKKLYLENKLTDFFSGYPAYGKNVTVKQLLTHTAGIPDHEKPLYKLINQRKNIWGYDRSTRYLEPTIYDALEVLKSQPTLLFPPGSKYRYSDAGYVLLALIIEKVSGVPYREFLKQNIFLPLGMTNSDVLDQSKPLIKNRALGYKIKSGVRPPAIAWRRNNWRTGNDGRSFEVFDYDPLNYIVGDEGVYSSIEDMVKWNRAWSEEVLVSKKSLAAAMTPARLTNGKAGRAGFSWLFGKVLNRFRVPPSLTVRLQELFVHGSRSIIRRAGKPGRTRVIYQDGAWVGFRNIILKIPEQKLTVIILSNRTDLDTERQRVSFAYKLAQKFV